MFVAQYTQKILNKLNYELVCFLNKNPTLSMQKWYGDFLICILVKKGGSRRLEHTQFTPIRY